MNPNKILHNTIHSQFNYHTLPVTPLKLNSDEQKKKQFSV